MRLNALPKYIKRRKIIGRGIGSGHGKTSGRGTKGQKARSGKKLRVGFEGGQTPLFQRLPKFRGFHSPNRVEYQVVNVGELAELGEKTITREVLVKHRLVRTINRPVKLLGDGELNTALSITLDKASKSAVEKVTKAGGVFNTVS